MVVTFINLKFHNGGKLNLKILFIKHDNTFKNYKIVWDGFPRSFKYKNYAANEYDGVKNLTTKILKTQKSKTIKLSCF